MIRGGLVHFKLFCFSCCGLVVTCTARLSRRGHTDISILLTYVPLHYSLFLSSITIKIAKAPAAKNMSDEPDAKKPNTTAEAAAGLQTEQPADLIQYLVIRQDLAYTEQKTADDGTTISTSTPWPTGAIVAQGAHAAVAAIAEGLRIHDVSTIAYTDKKSLDTMRKCVLGAKDVAALEKICAKMEKDDVKFYRWMEQPEDVLTAVATWPRPKPMLAKYFRGLKLLG